ncbi:ribonucleoside hydrolase [Periweissella cryptocerci]|uniref:Ribonucleoside hydrolase n=1 Tax=Periweissella cryptocerci TaxID=2506420 RepID=A0A4P6YVS8_9LACO|nr:nucleoside hydrolase [Periweissella cryptocerci]QBO36881.1 ribonucleoside hydrolase [Periweissella cryptocerci]
MKNIILDCDPGHEDFFGLMLALTSTEINIQAISTTVAYQTPENVQKNAMKALELLGRTDIPVARGAAKPLIEPFGLADNWRDFTGLDGANFPIPSFAPSQLSGIDLMAKTLSESAEPMTIAISGPVTNVALLVAAHPELHAKIEQIVLMGGAINTGNRYPGVEYNFSIDPEAAKILLNSGLPIVMATRDMTEQGIITEATVAKMRAIDNPVAQVAADLMENYGDFSDPDTPVVLNDPEVIAYLIDPMMFTGTDYYVDVETQGQLTRGRLVVDQNDMTGNLPNAKLLTSLDNDRFVALILDSLATY